VKKIILVCFAALALPGCAILKAEKWPEHGAGGLAEFTLTTDERLGAMISRLDTLRNAGARTFAAADFENAEILLARVQREFAGGLMLDGEASLHELNVLVASIERRTTPAKRIAGGVRR